MMNKIFNVKNIAIAVITLAIGTFVALGASKLFFGGTTTTVTGNVVSFILNPQGKVDGAILDTGDQVKFGAEAGEVVASNLQIGGQLTATGRAGTSSNYGREFHAETLQIGDQTITIAKGGKGPKDDKGDREGKRRNRGPKDGDRDRDRRDRSAPRDDEMTDEKPLPPDTENAPVGNHPQRETTTVSGNVKFIIVNKDGNPRGVILASGEQMNLGKEVENADLNFDTNTVISATGEIAKSNFGTFVRPQTISIGNQTFTFGR